MLKTTSGISGFDAITGGGLPAGQTTLVEGATGTGKTVFALQSVVHGAREANEPGIFVCFEESARRVREHADAFGWDLASIDEDRLCFLDAQPAADLVHSGDMDIAGLLATLEARVRSMGAKRVVLDAIDVVMALVDDETVVRREMYRLQAWLRERGLTAVVTSKAVDRSGPSSLPLLDFLPFMVDCLVRLDHNVVEGMSQRSLRVCKYRGSAFEENALPMLFGAGGIEVAWIAGRGGSEAQAGAERLSSGVASLDQMLGGGYFRGSSILVTGSPGTAKTTLAGTFAEAACERGEPTLFVSFDSNAAETARNLASVNIRLSRFVDAGLLRIVSMRALSGNAESAILRIRAEAMQAGARCLVVDPLSAVSKYGNRGTAPSVAERLIEWAKSGGITVLCTCLPEEVEEGAAGTPLQVSTIADTWIHLTYVINAGERNRGLSIIKSRGTSHSNQVRELVLGSKGVTLADVYTAGGEVLMGSMRWAREREQELAARERALEAQREHVRLQNEAADLQAQISVLQRKLDASREQEKSLSARTESTRWEHQWTRQRMHEKRLGTDPEKGSSGDGD